MAAIAPCTIRVYSNDGATLLQSNTYTQDITMQVTETGYGYDRNQIYTYTGYNIFRGFATTANSITTRYYAGDTFETSDFSNKVLKLYIVEEKVDRGVIIDYNGETIADLADGQKATIPCKGKKMSSDIVITGACEIVYKGKTIATVTDGQTATIKCNGKIMQDDITITASGTGEDTGGGETEEIILTAPTISLDGNTLTMTATDDNTQDFVIFVDGVETATVEV